MVQRDMRQYKVTRGNAKSSGFEATYEYTSGNKTNNKSLKAKRVK